MFACRRRSSMKRWGNRAITVGELVSTLVSWRTRTHQLTNSPTQQFTKLLFQLHNRAAAAPLVGRRGRKTRDEGMLLQEPRQRALQLSRAVSVNDAHDALIRQERFVEESLGARDRL